MLWAIYSGWLLKALDQDAVLHIRDCNTTYADDFLFSWLIRTGRDLENVYQAMKHVLSGLCSRGLELNMDHKLKHVSDAIRLIIRMAKATASNLCCRRAQVHQSRHTTCVFESDCELWEV